MVCLRSGQSLTPFVLDALLDVPETLVEGKRATIDHGIEFIRKNTTPDGVLGLMDETVADYPNYATALAVSVMVKAGKQGKEQDIHRMVTHLRAQQFTEANGWKPSYAPYGAWGWAAQFTSLPIPATWIFL
jgi:hypothetical protein